MEWERKKGKEGSERWELEKRDRFVYIICWYSLYYFNKLHVIEIRVLKYLISILKRNCSVRWVVKCDGKIDKIGFEYV